MYEIKTGVLPYGRCKDFTDVNTELLYVTDKMSGDASSMSLVTLKYMNVRGVRRMNHNISIIQTKRLSFCRINSSSDIEKKKMKSFS